MVSSRSPQAMAHRLGRSTLTLSTPDGRPLTSTDVVVERLGHAFGFGNIGFDLVALANGETTIDPSSPVGAADPA